MAKILCFGSLNIDDLFSVPNIVEPGQTIASESYSVHAGGKGANQSVAIAKAGGSVVHAGKIGPDGLWIRDMMQHIGVDTKFITVDSSSKTGRAIVQVSHSGENAIILFPGSNHLLTTTDIDLVFSTQWWEKGSWILMQNEINNGFDIMTRAKNGGFRVAFNPAPLSPTIVSDFPFGLVDLLVVNEGETRALLTCFGSDTRSQPLTSTDTQSFKKPLETLTRFLPSLSYLVMTLGANGVCFYEKSTNLIRHVSGVTVNVVDTTGAGDTFIGYLLANLSKGVEFGECVRVAIKASAMCCEKKGAMEAVPTCEEVQRRWFQ